MDWPLNAGFGDAQFYNGASTGSLTPNTKGAWSEIVAALPNDISHYSVSWGLATSSLPYSTLIDIGIGPSGSEVVVIPNLHASQNIYGGWVDTGKVVLPLSLRKGTRLAIRSQDTIGGQTAVAYGSGIVRTFNAPAPLAQGYTAEGVDLSASSGTGVPLGNGGWGAWTEITAAAARSYRWLMAMMTSPSSGDMSVECQIGIGASGSERAIADGELIWRGYTLSNTVSKCFYNGPCHIPKGTRIAARFGDIGQNLIPAKVVVYGGS